MDGAYQPLRLSVNGLSRFSKETKNEIENGGVQGIAFSRYSSLVTFGFSR